LAINTPILRLNFLDIGVYFVYNETSGQANRKEQEMDKEKKKMEEIFDKGVEYLEAGNLREAITEFEEVIKENKDDAAAHFNLGLACMRMARTDIAKDELYEDKMDEEGWILRAIAEFNKVLELEPENAEAKDNIKALNELLSLGD